MAIKFHYVDAIRNPLTIPACPPPIKHTALSHITDDAEQHQKPHKY